MKRVLACGLAAVALIGLALFAAQDKSDAPREKNIEMILRDLRQELSKDIRLSRVWIEDIPRKENKKEKKTIVFLEGRSLVPENQIKDELLKTVKEKLPALWSKHLPGSDDKFDEFKFREGQFWFPKESSLLVDWQSAVDGKELPGVLFLDAWFLPDGDVQVVALADGAAAKEKAEKLVAGWQEEAGKKGAKGAPTWKLHYFFESPSGKEESWVRSLQKDLGAGAKGEDVAQRGLFRHTKISGVGWWADGEGKPHARLHGLSLQSAPAGAKKEDWESKQREALKTRLEKTFDKLLGELKTRLEQEQKSSPQDARSRMLKLPPFSAAPTLQAKYVVFIDNPVLALRKRAVSTESLFGAVLADHFFDDDGVLQVIGIVRDSQQKKEILETIEKAVAGKAKVAGESMVVLPESELPAKLQPALAAAPKDDVLGRTRLDRASFRYSAGDGKAGPELRLRFEGACLTDLPADRDALKTALQKKIGDVLEEKLKFRLTDVAVDAENITISKVDPIEELQDLMNEEKALKGVLLKELRFDGKGGVVPVLSPSTPALKEKVAKLIPNAKNLQKLLGKPAEEKPKEDKPEEIAFLAEPEFAREPILVELRKRLAADPVMRHVRIDRFLWKRKDHKWRLLIEGVSLTPLGKIRKPLADFLGKELVGLLEKEDGEPFAEKPAIDLDTPLFKAEPKSPLFELQQKTRGNPALDGVLFTDLFYSETAELIVAARVANEKRQRPLVAALIGANAGLGALAVSAPWKKDKLIASIKEHGWVAEEKIADWPDLLRSWGKTRARSGPMAKRTRIDSAWFSYDEDTLKLHLALAGVCIHPNKDRKELQAALKPATDANIKKYLPDYDLDVEKINYEPLALRQLQALIADDESLDGVLLYDPRYDGDGVLLFSGIVGKEEHKAKVEAVLTRNLRGAILVPEERKLPRRWQVLFDEPPLDWARLLERVRRRFEAREDRLALRSFLARSFFTYGDDQIVPHMNWRAVHIRTDPEPKSASEIKKEIESRLQVIAKDLMGLPAPLLVEVDVNTLDNPARRLQEAIVKQEKLDGVGITGATFEWQGTLVFNGVWRDEKAQEKLLNDTTREFLKRQPGFLSRALFKLNCRVLGTGKLLEDLNGWAATQNEMHFNRLYFDTTGTLTFTGHYVNKADEEKIKEKIAELLRKHPHFNGRFTLEEVAAGPPREDRHFVAFRPDEPPAPKEPKRILELRQPVAPALRKSVQNQGKEGPSTQEWDGILIVRGKYTPDGKFGLVGLCDQKPQLDALLEKLKTLRGEVGTPYHEALSGGIDLSEVRPMALAPMLERMRLVLPAYARFDGLIIDSAGHDQDGALIVRVNLIGPSPGEGQAAELRKQLQTHKVWSARVGDGLRWMVLSRKPRDARLAHQLRQQAVRNLSKSLCNPYAPPPAFDPIEGENPVSAWSEQAIRQVTPAVMHEPSNSTAWFVRAMYHALQNDPVRAHRDLRRMHELEIDPDFGKGQRDERLELIEGLQGEARRRMGLLERRVAQDVAAARRPLRIAGAE
jgi:hypothetical protein